MYSTHGQLAESAQRGFEHKLDHTNNGAPGAKQMKQQDNFISPATPMQILLRQLPPTVPLDELHLRFSQLRAALEGSELHRANIAIRMQSLHNQNSELRNVVAHLQMAAMVEPGPEATARGEGTEQGRIASLKAEHADALFRWQQDTDTVKAQLAATRNELDRLQREKVRETIWAQMSVVLQSQRRRRSDAIAEASARESESAERLQRIAAERDQLREEVKRLTGAGQLLTSELNAAQKQNTAQKQQNEETVAQLRNLEKRLHDNDNDLIYAKSHIEGLQQEIQSRQQRGVLDDVRRYEEELSKVTAEHRHRDAMLRRQMEARDNDHSAQVEALKLDILKLQSKNRTLEMQQKQAPEESERLLDEYYAECSKLKDLNGSLCSTNEHMRGTLRETFAQAAQEHQDKLQQLRSQHADHIASLEQALAASEQEHARHMATFESQLTEQMSADVSSSTTEAHARMDALRQELQRARRDAARAQEELQSQHADRIAKLKDEHKRTLQLELADALRATNDMRTTLRENSAKAVQEHQDQLQQLRSQHADHIARLEDEHQQSLEQALAASEQEHARHMATFESQLTEQISADVSSSTTEAHERMDALRQELQNARRDAAKAQEELQSQHADHIAKLKDEHKRMLQSKLADALRATNDMRATLRENSAKAVQEHQDQLQQLRSQHADHIARLEDERQQSLERALAASEQEHARQMATFESQLAERRSAEVRSSTTEAHERMDALRQELQNARTDAAKAQEELQSQHADHIAKLKDEHKRTLQSELADALRAMRATLRENSAISAQEYRDKLQQLRSQHADHIARLEDEHQQSLERALAASEQEHARQMATFESQLAERMSAEVRSSTTEAHERMDALRQELQKARTDAARAQEELQSQHADRIAKLKGEHKRTLQSKLADALSATNDMRATLRENSAKAVREHQDQLQQLRSQHADHIARLEDEHQQSLKRAVQSARSDAATARQQLRMQLAASQQHEREQAKRARSFASQRNAAEERRARLEAAHRVQIEELSEHKRALQSELSTQKKILQRLVGGTPGLNDTFSRGADGASRARSLHVTSTRTRSDLDRQPLVLDSASVGSSISSTMFSTADRDTIAASTRTSVVDEERDIGSPGRRSRLMPIPSPEPIFVTPPRFKRTVTPQKNDRNEAPVWTSFQSNNVRHPEQVSPAQTLALMNSRRGMENKVAGTSARAISTQLSNSYEYMKKMLRSSQESFALLQKSF